MTEILVNGRKNNASNWFVDCKCTGRGHKGGGCGALHRVSQKSLYSVPSYDGFHRQPSYLPTFYCNYCGIETSLSYFKKPDYIKLLGTRPTEEQRLEKIKNAVIPPLSLQKMKENSLSWFSRILGCS